MMGTSLKASIVIGFSLGMVVAPLHAEFPIVVKEGHQTQPEVAPIGYGCLAAWRGAGVWVTRIDSQGTVVDTGGFLVAEPVVPGGLALASDGYECLVLYADFGAESVWTINANHIRPDAMCSPPVTLVSSEHQLMNPDVAFMDSLYLVIWEEVLFPQKTIWIRQVNCEGRPVGSPELLVTGLDPAECQPKVTASRDYYMVVWADYPQLLAARVSSSGEVLDPGGIVVADGLVEDVCAGSDGTQFVVGWDDGFSIFMKRIDSSGVVLDDDPILVYGGAEWNTGPDVCFGAGGYLFSWYSSGSGWDILAAKVDVEGNVLDSVPMGICLAEENQTDVSVAWFSGHFIAAWQDYRNLDFDIYGQLIDVASCEEMLRNTESSRRWLSASPNPFGSHINLRVRVERQGPLSIRIFDLSGRLVRELFRGEKGPGAWIFSWDSRDDRGRPVPSGYYSCVCEQTNGLEGMVLVKLR